MPVKPATRWAQTWREKTDRRRVEVWLPKATAEALDAEKRATGAAGRGEVIARLVEAAQAHQAHQGPGHDRDRLERVREVLDAWDGKATKAPPWRYVRELLGELREAMGDEDLAPEPPPDLEVRPLPQDQARRSEQAVVYLAGRRIGTCWKGRGGWYGALDRSEIPAGKPPMLVQADTRQWAAEKLAGELTTK